MFETEVDAMADRLCQCLDEMGDRLCQRLDAFHNRFVWRFGMLLIINLVLTVSLTVFLVKYL